MKHKSGIDSLLDGQEETQPVHGGDIFEFEPVPLPVFITDRQFLGLPPLSPKQHDAVDICTQIYFEDTLAALQWRKRRYINKACLLWGKGCLHKDTLLINSETGEVDTVENLTYKGQSISVSSVNKSNKISIKKSSIPWRVKKDTVYTVELADGSFIDANKTHRLLTPYEWKEIKDLKIGETVAVSTYEYEGGLDIDFDVAWLLGVIIGDGSISSKDSSIIVYMSDKGMIKRLKRIVGKFGCKLVLVEIRNAVCFVFRITALKQKYNPILRMLKLYGLVGKNAYSKFVPLDVFRWKKCARLELLRGLIETDGHVSSYKNNGFLLTEVGYSSVSKKLVLDVKRLLASFGVFSRISRKSTPSNFGVSYVTRIRDRHNGEKILKLLGWSELGRWEGKSDKSGDINFVKIKSIKQKGYYNVFDLEVDETHNYVDFNGVVSHNSGKDFVARIMFLRMVYLLMCLKNPQVYFYDPRFQYSIEHIDLLNTAANDTQAVNVFFAPLRQYVTKSPFFKTRCEVFTHSILFDKAIRIFSGNSEAEPMEGMNLLAVILDEIAAFKTDEEVDDLRRTRARKIIPRSASSLYEMALTSVTTRFPKVGKVVSISFPRFKGDFITTLYDEYKNDSNCFASFGSTFEVNPTKKIGDFEDLKRTNPALYNCRILCNPGIAEDAFFKNASALEKAFPKDVLSPFDMETGRIRPWLFCKDNFMRFGHIDLSKNKDRAAVCFVHAYDIQKDNVYMEDKKCYVEVESPLVKVDILMYFQAPPGGEVDYDKILQRIIELEEDRGFNFNLITFDGYQSVHMRQTLEKRGITCDELSVDKIRAPYEALQEVIYSNRLKGYYDKILMEEELPFLIDFKGRKIEHRKGKSKDGSDALAGAVYNCVASDEWGASEFWVAGK